MAVDRRRLRVGADFCFLHGSPRSPRLCANPLMPSSHSFVARAASALLLLAVVTASAAAASAWLHDLTGSWTFSVVTENGTGTPAVTMKQTGEKLTGTYESRMLGPRAFAGTVKGDSVNFTLEANGPDGVALIFKGVIVSADSLRGLVDFGGMGGATFTGTRNK
jgi:hypothetical protein